MTAPFRVDSLESRRLLSGDVLVKVLYGRLVALGDNQDNAIVINDDGLAAGQLRVTASGGTTINGSADPLVLSGVTRGIAAHLRGGNDTVTIDGVALATGRLQLHGGGGNDAINVLNSTIAGRTRLHGGGGDDSVVLTGSTFNGRFDIRNGGGHNSVTLGGALFNGRKKIHLHKKRDVLSTTAPVQTPINLSFDFRNGDQGFQAGFADYPAGEEAFYELKSGVQQLPAELGAGTGFYLSGNNHSDDLFMFLERALTAADGIKANQSYTVSFQITFASDAPTGCVGVGGAPGESVYLKAGATATNPEAVAVDGQMTLNVDKGNQAEGGAAASTAGDIANGIACDVAVQSPSLPYASVTRTHTHTATVTADASGNLHLIVGTDSGFEGVTNIYFQQINVTLTPAGSTPGNGDTDGDSDGKSDGDSDGDSDGKSDGKSDGNSDGNSDGASDGDSGGKSDGQSDGKSDGNSDGASDGDSDGKSDADSDGDGDDDDDDKKEKKPKKDKGDKKAKKPRKIKLARGKH